jgi:hypothetical protein
MYKLRCIPAIKIERFYQCRYRRHSQDVESKRRERTNAYVSHGAHWIREKYCRNGCTAILL